MIRIAVLASGNGTNAEQLIKHFYFSSVARVTLVLTNNKNAKVLERANRLKVNTVIFDKYDLYESKSVEVLLKDQADFIVLAGFLWKIPLSLIRAFPNKIINIHPALLPRFGGKGMYGMRVHKAVKESGSDKTGISIHYVNEHYDEGNIIFQTETEVLPEDSPEVIAEKVHRLEYSHFPRITEDLIFKTFNITP